MSNYIERMINERDSLQVKINKAEKVISNNLFELNTRQISLLNEQITYMKKYLNILTIRIGEEKNELC